MVGWVKDIGRARGSEVFLYLAFSLGLLLGGAPWWVLAASHYGSIIRAEQRKAVEAGVGRWTVDPATGEKRFEYGKGE